MDDDTCQNRGEKSLIVLTLKEHEKARGEMPGLRKQDIQQQYSTFIASTTRKS